MHLFMAALSTETNTFSPIPTGLSAYEAFYLRHGTATDDPPNLMTEALHVWRRRATELGWSVTESLTAIAEPAGKTTRAARKALMDEILDDLQTAGDPEIILLQLHGAMVADDEEDCEGALSEAIRAVCPNAIIGVALDLHCHLTDRLLRAADLVIAFKEYPHDDAADRAEELFDLARRTQSGEITPKMALFDCRMVALYLTKVSPMQDFVAELKATEAKDGILSVTLGHGFPWADLPETGARMLVIADGDQEVAEHTAEELGQRFYDLRQQIVPSYPGLDEALNQASGIAEYPVVLADMSDNSGAGAPGDSTHVLRALLDRGLTNVASGLYWDPVAVDFCVQAGEGAQLRLRLGGKVEPASGMPVDVEGVVTRIATGLTQRLGSSHEPLGQMVWFELDGGISLVLNDLRTQVYHPEAFTQLGIDLSNKHLIVVKSLFHFYSPFSEIASEVIFCATPGRVNPDTTGIPFTRRDLNYWPRIGNAF